MDTKFATLCFLTALSSSVLGNPALAAVAQLTSPDEILSSRRISFDGFANETIANSLFQGQGLLFSRDDGGPVYISDWSALGRVTSSAPNVLATISVFGTGFRWATHLNIQSSLPLFAMGAYFGNDQSDPDYSLTRLSVYGLSDELLGSVDVPVNNNLSVDQFIGIRSDEPFFRARFENLAGPQSSSDSYSVVLDDLVFSSVQQSKKPTSIVIDIRPGTEANPVNVKSRGKIPVAILGRATFDVSNVDVTSLRFGPLGGPAVSGQELSDSNEDGFLDLVLHFDIQESGIVCGMVSARLSGSLTSGELIEGTDSIRIEGCEKALGI